MKTKPFHRSLQAGKEKLSGGIGEGPQVMASVEKVNGEHRHRF